MHEGVSYARRKGWLSAVILHSFAACTWTVLPCCSRPALLTTLRVRAAQHAGSIYAQFGSDSQAYMCVRLSAAAAVDSDRGSRPVLCDCQPIPSDRLHAVNSMLVSKLI